MSRKLKKEEIEEIIDFVEPNPHIPRDSAMAIVENAKNRLRKQLKDQIVYPGIIPLLKKELEKTYYRSFIQPGESVGVICAQSIGEKQTQTTLNTFHKAGQSEKTMTSGVPRFQELINATKKPRIVNHKIYMKKDCKTIEEIREVCNHQIIGLTLKDISKDIEIHMKKGNEKWYPLFRDIYNKNFDKYNEYICVKLDLDKLYRYKIKPKQIADKIESEYEDISCVFSPLHIGELHVYVDTEEITLPKDRVLFVNTENAKEIYMEECVKDNLEKINLFGVEGINEIFFTNENEWFVETNGINSREISTRFINFKALLKLDIVDEFRTISNNVWDIYEVLGIEAARQFLIDEFMSIMDGINLCHSSLLVDRMTFGGTIYSITRYTMKKAENGPFGKASFEETMDNFINAAARGEIEPTRGVSASIMCGKRARIGTGMFGLKLDLGKIAGIF